MTELALVLWTIGVPLAISAHHALTGSELGAPDRALWFFLWLIGIAFFVWRVVR